MARLGLWTIATVAAAWLGLTAPASARPSADTLRTAAEEIRAAAHVPSLGLGVIDRGRIVFLEGLGEVEGRKATERDRYRAASISKLFAAQAVMKLAERGRLNLDDDVARWLPAFRGRGVTLRHLLTHRAGLRDAVFPIEADDPARVGAYVDIVARQPAAPAPGAGYGYTDADYNVLGAVVEAASGMPYAAFVQREIIGPLKLRDTQAFPTVQARSGVAPPFLNKPAVRPATPRPYDVAFAPAEGLVTSVRDLTLWTQATLRRDRRLLKPASFEAMLATQAEGARPGRRAGLGWQLREEGGRRVAEHGGAIRGYNALVLTYPDEGRAVVILTNADDAPRWELARKVDELLGRQ
jgi:CubicO group peptidase (beta-lactamase class C family)